MGLEKTKTELQSLFSRHNLKLDPSQSLFRQFDSLQLVELVVQIESEFKVKLPSFAITPENFASFESIASLIQKQRGQN